MDSDTPTEPPMEQRDWRQMEDAVLIDAHLKGNAEAFEVLFRKHVDRLSRLVYSIVKESSLVEDIVQDVFLLVYRYLPRFRRDSSFKTWVYRITVNEAVRQANKSRRWVNLSDRDIEDLTPRATVMILDSGPNPERVLLEGQQRQMMQEALQGLKPHHRAILSLYYLEELSVQEVAEVLDIPEGSVKSRLYYARDNLKKLLEPMLKQEQFEPGRANHQL